ncbi:hypothetical protein [Pedobacter immunditicola]|uniref:hypothetical protein n=1 Tax=Pedobacter immunditicola TaxID=3133440 RepID=UPI0030974B96
MTNTFSLQQPAFYWCFDKTGSAIFSALILFILSTPIALKAQQLEVRGSLNSGFYSYSGNGAVSVSRINGTSHTNNPYGSRGGLSYGLSLNIRKVTKSNFIFGADLGYEMLRSKVKLDYSDVIGDIASDFEGRTYLNTSFINLFPFLGRRFNMSQQAFDLVAGLDIGHVLKARENGDAKSTDNAAFHIETSRDRKSLNRDLRARIQLSTDFGKMGVYAGYAHGVRNYRAGLDGMTVEAYSRMWRVGVTYRLK